MLAVPAIWMLHIQHDLWALAGFGATEFLVESLRDVHALLVSKCGPSTFCTKRPGDGDAMKASKTSCGTLS